MKTVSDRLFSAIEIGVDKVKIFFIEKLFLERKSEQEAGDEPTEYEDEYSVKTKKKPHKDFTAAINKLKKWVVEINELPEGDEKKLRITGMEIKGSIESRTARVIISCERIIERNDKKYAFSTPDTPLFDPEDLKDCEGLLKVVNGVINETHKYLEGKNGVQVAMFADKAE